MSFFIGKCSKEKHQNKTGFNFTFARIVDISGDLDKAIIETEVVSDTVLPLRKPVSVVDKPEIINISY